MAEDAFGETIAVRFHFFFKLPRKRNAILQSGPGPLWIVGQTSADVLFESEPLLNELLMTDLGVCATFINSAEIELSFGSREHSHTVLAKAERAVEVIDGYLPKVKNAKHKAEIENRLDELRKSLGAVHHKLAQE